MANKKKQRLVITISGERPIHDVANDLRTAGLEVDRVLASAGSVTGSALPGTAERLRSIPCLRIIRLISGRPALRSPSLSLDWSWYICCLNRLTDDQS
jgi:hypothetical protein